MADPEDSTHRTPPPSSERRHQGRLFDPTPPALASLLVATTDPLDVPPAVGVVILDTVHRGPEACFGRRHRCPRGETVKVCQRGGEWVDGIVLTEGFDVHRHHVGWVGVPGVTVLWRRLCGLEHGDDAELARASQRAEAAGIVVQVRT